MTKQDTWDSWGGNMGVSTPVPAGQYDCLLKEASVSYDDGGRARTSLTFNIVQGDHLGRYLWLDWPHDPAKFGWCARMMWEACGFDSMPEGDNPEQMLMSISRGVCDAQGRTFKLTTDVRTYKTADNQTKSKSRVKRVESLNYAPQNNAAPVGDAPQW